MISRNWIFLQKNKKKPNLRFFFPNNVPNWLVKKVTKFVGKTSLVPNSVDLTVVREKLYQINRCVLSNCLRRPTKRRVLRSSVIVDKKMEIIIFHISNNSIRVRSWKPPNYYSDHIYCDKIVKEFQYFTTMIWRIHSKMVINVGNMADMNEESASFESQVHTKGFMTCNHMKICPLFWWALGGQRRLHTLR